MTSWRMTVNQIDRSQTIVQNIGTTGAIVIDSERGPSLPTLFSPGNEARLRDIFGWPKAGNEAVYDAIMYNRKAPLWACGMFALTDKGENLVVTSTGVTAGAGVTGTNLLSTSYSPYTGASLATEYFQIASKYPNKNNFLSMTCVQNATTKLFDITLYIIRSAVAPEVYGTYSVSLIPGTQGNFGKSAYILDVFANHDLVNIYMNTFTASQASPPTYPTTGAGITTVLAFAGGSKAATSITLHSTAWANFTSASRYKADIFMNANPTTTLADATTDVTTFNSLSANNAPYADFLWTFPKGNSPQSIWTSGTGFRYSSPGTGAINNRNLHLLFNWAYVTYEGNGLSFWSNLVGTHATKYVAMANIYNALSPSWIDEDNHGGQLDGQINYFEFDPSETDLQALDGAGVNARTYHPSYGPMIMSDKTGKTPSIVSDDSFVGTSRMFNYIISNIVDQVLVFQITKLNDEFHRRLAIQKASQILNPLKQAGVLMDFKIKCDTSTGSNDATARANRQFLFAVAVQATPNSQTLVFNFLKVGQTVTVDSVLAS